MSPFLWGAKLCHRCLGDQARLHSPGSPPSLGYLTLDLLSSPQEPLLPVPQPLRVTHHSSVPRTFLVSGNPSVLDKQDGWSLHSCSTGPCHRGSSIPLSLSLDSALPPLQGSSAVHTHLPQDGERGIKQTSPVFAPGLKYK